MPRNTLRKKNKKKTKHLWKNKHNEFYLTSKMGTFFECWEVDDEKSFYLTFSDVLVEVC